MLCPVCVIENLADKTQHRAKKEFTFNGYFQPVDLGSAHHPEKSVGRAVRRNPELDHARPHRALTLWP